MVRSDFIFQTFNFDVTDDDQIDRSISAAERAIGKSLSAVVEGSREQDWFVNVAKRSYLMWMTQNYLTEHNYGSAQLQQKFQNHLELLKLLKEEWEEMRLEIKKATTPESLFQVINPGYDYDEFGRRL